MRSWDSARLREGRLPPDELLRLVQEVLREE
jgi:hypothetical protein